MKKYFICADIHGFYDIWMNALDEKGFDINNPDHIVILLGDLLDRGDQPRDCLRFICNLIDKNRAICIMGNHEDLMRELLLYKCPAERDYHNGTKATVDDLINYDYTFREKCFALLTDEQWCKYFNKCNNYLYYETDHYIFTHSYLPYDSYDWKLLENWRDKNCTKYYYGSKWYEEALWANPFLMWERNGKTYIDGKTLVCGHWNTSWAHKKYHGYDKEYLERVETMWMDSEGIIHPTCCYDIFEDEGIIGLDACTVVSKQINVLVLEEL